MINHARTLLANLPPGSLGDFAEEFIPDGFLPVRLPHAVNQARRILFGADPDRWMVNYRCRQLMTIVHATTLAAMVTALDPRVGYSMMDLVNPALYVPLVSRTLRVVGSPLAPDRSGQMHHLFQVEVLDENTVSILRLSPPSAKALLRYTLTSDLSEPLPLPGSGYSVRLSGGSSGVLSVEVLNRPTAELGTLVSTFALLSDASVVSLFHAGKGQPFDKLYSVWQREKETPLRIAALTLAVIYRSEEARTGG